MASCLVLTLAGSAAPSTVAPSPQEPSPQALSHAAPSPKAPGLTTSAVPGAEPALAAPTRHADAPRPAAPHSGTSAPRYVAPYTGAHAPRAAVPHTGARAPRYVAPLAGELDLLRGFDPPAVRWGAGHRGVDLGAPVGQPVRSPGPGIVSFAGDVAGRGVVTVVHPDGLRSSLEPVDPTVDPGDHVEAGDPIGALSAVPGHCAPSSCLHWGVRDGDTYVSPLRLLRAGPTVLLPGP